MDKFKSLLMAFGLMVGGMECFAQTVNGHVKGHGYVDLGLTSGIKWATCNIGANKPTDSGFYFSWSEIKPKDSYTWDNYKWGMSTNDEDIMTKYCADDNLKVAEKADDAANANWGKKWRMPTVDEYRELVDGCDWKWEEDYNGLGVNGLLGTSRKNGNTIFLPAAGQKMEKDSYFHGDVGYYWSSSIYEEEGMDGYAWYLFVESDSVKCDYMFRTSGMSVRAVVQ